MSQNEFYPIPSLPKKEDLEKLVKDYHYCKISADKVPDEITNNGLSKKMNSYILAASGSTSGICYSFVGLRPDKGNTVIDEHPFLFYYDYSDPTKNFGGILDHGDWPDRTKPLEQWQIDILIASGLTTEFTYKSIPPKSSGSLDNLNNNNMLKGLSKQFEVLLKNQQKNYEKTRVYQKRNVAVRKGNR